MVLDDQETIEWEWRGNRRRQRSLGGDFRCRAAALSTPPSLARRHFYVRVLG